LAREFYETASVDFSKNVLVFKPGETKAFVEIELSGKASEPKAFTVELENADEATRAKFADPGSKVFLGTNKSATVSIISSQGKTQRSFI